MPSLLESIRVVKTPRPLPPDDDDSDLSAPEEYAAARANLCRGLLEIDRRETARRLAATREAIAYLTRPL